MTIETKFAVEKYFKYYCIGMMNVATHRLKDQGGKSMTEPGTAMDLQRKINSAVSMQIETIESAPEKKYSAQEVLELLKLQREAERERCALALHVFELRMAQIGDEPREPGFYGRGTVKGTAWKEAVAVLRMAEAKIRSGE